MSMPMVDVGIVRVAVSERLVHVRMRVRLLAVPRKIVSMLMVFVMTMAMHMRKRIVRMRVFVAFCQMEPDATRHEC